LAHITRVFDKEFMQLVLWEDKEGTEILENKIYDTSRWSNHYNLVFSFEGKIYETDYSVGATESQDERAWEYDTDVTCWEVEAKEVTIIQYVPVSV
jgi:hypothetical protein